MSFEAGLLLIGLAVGIYAAYDLYRFENRCRQESEDAQ
jgi:hypothetical protein